MRITQGMIQNSSLNTMYNNMNNLNSLYNQMNTLKKIQRPSDDPIIAGRSLKLRLNVMEATQHANNVDEATSWMEVTEAALKNTTEIIKDIRTRCVQAANGTLTAEDREKIVSDMKQLYTQLKQEANVSYAGRYVFSGYKTDQPVFLDKATKLEKDVELKADLKLTGDMTLKNDLELSSDCIVTEDITLPAGTVVNVNPVGSDRVVTNADGTVTIKASTTTPPEKLGADVTIPAGTVLAANTTIPTGEPNATVLKAGETLPAGVLNPAVHGYTDGQRIEYEIGVNNTLDINTLGMPEMMHKLLNNIEGMIDKLSDESLTDEELNQIFTDMIGEMDERSKETSEMTADLGSKQNRLEYTQSRLKEDKVNFTELLSNTEDVDLEEVYVEFNTQYMIYQSGLQATSKIIMNTLADFLR